MQQLRYVDEIRAFSEIPVGDTEVKDAELNLALQIVEQAVSESFRPEVYRDEVRERFEEAIQQKVEGQEITAEPAEQPKAQVIDLMEALKASLAQAAERKPAKRAPADQATEGKSAKRPSQGRARSKR